MLVRFVLEPAHLIATEGFLPPLEPQAHKVTPPVIKPHFSKKSTMTHSHRCAPNLHSRYPSLNKPISSQTTQLLDPSGLRNIWLTGFSGGRVFWRGTNPGSAGENDSVRGSARKIFMFLTLTQSLHSRSGTLILLYFFPICHPRIPSLGMHSEPKILLRVEELRVMSEGVVCIRGRIWLVASSGGSKTGLFLERLDCWIWN